jgi:cytochrome c biogenesis protein CcmG, thiol:disulfide interchange protein DsbE
VTPHRRLSAAVAALSVVVVACGSDDGPTASGEMLPDVDVVALADGATTNLADVDGPAVINLWATWCVPCRREIPDFEEVNRARGDEITFVGINVGEDADQAQEFIEEVGATYDQYLDPDGHAVTELDTAAMPVTIIIDADGEMVTRHLGPMDQDELNEAIDDALD